jgi:hypothetical protein
MFHPPPLNSPLQGAQTAIGIVPGMFGLETIEEFTTCLPRFGQEPDA